jgi:hypothetical protein
MNWLQGNIKTSGLIISFVILFSLKMFGQQELVIKHRFKPNKQKSLKLKKEYTITTADSIYKRIKIIDFTNTSITIVKHWPFNDTIQASFAEIQIIKKHWSVNGDIRGATGYLLFFSMFFAIGGTYSWVIEGDESAASEIFLVAVCCAVPLVTVIALEQIRNKYDLQQDWEFVEKQDNNR